MEQITHNGATFLVWKGSELSTEEGCTLVSEGAYCYELEDWEDDEFGLVAGIAQKCGIGYGEAFYTKDF